ncbi:MAG: hypothetical protein ALECFALPRED_003605 [Alectoria fallacina]|uniref:Uncharacterized protein n=1 Tax=Alectoria fallacina TaxID=1903189 RepID=A0A8H3IN38_9LECA|nr:MAG: hypothetical protein ALECFALPRED_003605 [Alectoria fallacina]
MPLSDALVHSAFIEYVAQNKKEKRVRCRHCQKDSAKHTSRQRDHLIKCRPYLKAMKDQEKHNSITRKAAGMVDDSDDEGGVSLIGHEDMAMASEHEASEHEISDHEDIAMAEHEDVRHEDVQEEEEEEEEA